MRVGATSTQTPAARVAGFIGKFDPSIARLARAARRRLRRRFPTALELVYDNYNALALAFAPNERTSEAFVSLAVFPRGVSLYFVRGASLADPRGLLEGMGTKGRFIRLTSAAQIDSPPVAALLGAAVRAGRSPLPKSGRGTTIVKSVSARQRSRRARPSA